MSEVTIDRSSTLDTLFEPAQIAGLSVRNRFVMAPMTRCESPDGRPTTEVATYYGRRAQGGVGLIITEGTSVGHPAASNDSNIPRFEGDALPGWKQVVDAAHAGGARIVPQLWHAGLLRKWHAHGVKHGYGARQEVSPSGWLNSDEKICDPMSTDDIEAVVTAFGAAAHDAHELGFDGIELQGAHGYLIDQFLWAGTNRRNDRYGGTLGRRSQFAADIVAECRRMTTPDFPIIFRFSQWKQQDYRAQLATTPEELEQVLSPLCDAGVDIFHPSQRRYWQPEFDGSDRTLAGWTRKVTGKPAIIVGSVGLALDLRKAGFAAGAAAEVASLERIPAMFDRGEFDLVAVGRLMLGNPEWCNAVRAGRLADIKPYSSEMLARLT
jgi:2,4-dienoyl-CoA reductase-like NADH-dependent reductase (Old Yellow Enzyme family)